MEICTVGGYEEVGRNMTAVKVGEDVILFDAGLDIPGIVELQEENILKYTETRFKQGNKKNYQGQYSEKQLRDFGAIPDDRILDKIGWRQKVIAIIISHAHLDHIGGLPYIANRYPNATIYGTPFTMKFLETILKDERMRIQNPLKTVKLNSTISVQGKSETYKIDFVGTTHSIPHCVFPVLHTKEGIFFYALDLKFDNYPTLGSAPNYNKMRELGKKGVKVAVIDALYSGTEKKPGGEIIAKNLLEDAMSKVKGKNSAFFVTTFSSHIERLINIVKIAKKTGREIVLIGRSLSKYVESASKVNLWPFKGIRLIKYSKQRESFLRSLERNRGKYFIICTGHQAEENSVLDRIVRGNLPFQFRQGDNLIFSSSVIPVPVNILAREKLDKKLRKIGVKIQTDIHVHGHGSREDMRELLEMIKSKHIIPAHGTLQQETPFIELASEFGYKFRETSHLSSNGEVLKF